MKQVGFLSRVGRELIGCKGGYETVARLCGVSDSRTVKKWYEGSQRLQRHSCESLAPILGLNREDWWVLIEGNKGKLSTFDGELYREHFEKEVTSQEVFDEITSWCCEKRFVKLLEIAQEQYKMDNTPCILIEQHIPSRMPDTILWVGGIWGANFLYDGLDQLVGLDKGVIKNLLCNEEIDIDSFNKLCDFLCVPNELRKSWENQQCIRRI